MSLYFCVTCLVYPAMQLFSSTFFRFKVLMTLYNIITRWTFGRKNARASDTWYQKPLIGNLLSSQHAIKEAIWGFSFPATFPQFSLKKINKITTPHRSSLIWSNVVRKSICVRMHHSYFVEKLFPLEEVFETSEKTQKCTKKAEFCSSAKKPKV